MGRVHTHYDNLKVARDASPEQIRASYRRLTKKYHPDKNPGDAEAARIMAIVNVSHDILSDPAKRREHDRWIEAEETGRRRPAAAPIPDLPEAGCCDLEAMRRDQIEKLLQMQNGVGAQAVQVEQIHWKYLVLMLFGVWVYVLFDTDRSDWHGASLLWLVFFTGLIGYHTAKQLLFLILWHTEQLRCALIVSPLYIIHAYFDRVRFWPLWNLGGIQATHGYRYGAYTETTVRMTFGEKTEAFRIFSKKDYERFFAALHGYSAILQESVNSGDADYVRRHDIFYGCALKRSQTTVEFPARRRTQVYNGMFTACVVLLVSAYLHSKPAISSGPPPAVSKPATPTTSANTIIQDELNAFRLKNDSRNTYIRPLTAPNGEAWPLQAGYVNGYMRLNTGGLSSVAIDNSRNTADVFVKLMERRGNVAKPVRVFFIPAKTSFTVYNITPGAYDVRYRDLDSGELYRSGLFDLTETKTSDGTRYNNVEMTLYKVSHDNMRTQIIAESEF